MSPARGGRAGPGEAGAVQERETARTRSQSKTPAGRTAGGTGTAGLTDASGRGAATTAKTPPAKKRTPTGKATGASPATPASSAAGRASAARGGPRSGAHPADRVARVAVEDVWPRVDDGRFPVKRVVGDEVEVWADLFADGHGVVRGVVRHRREGGRWSEAPMEPVDNDRFRGAFRVGAVGVHEYVVHGWVDPLRSWQADLRKRLEAGRVEEVDAQEGALLVHRALDAARAAGRTQAGDGFRLEDVRRWADSLDAGSGASLEERCHRALDPTMTDAADPLVRLLAPGGDGPTYRVRVDPEHARHSAWYELFPRSASPEPGRHGTLRDVEARLDEVAAMGFDVLYLPPVHPIGTTARKGPDHTSRARPGDPGSPWAIGSDEGGHEAVHPELGTVADYERLARTARQKGMELAFDLALQCSPDHPWVKQHPEWFQHLPDGSIRHAENPPKKYEDIVPLDFLCPDPDARRALWDAVRDLILLWVGRGVRLFRVDNPHTKPFDFWEWLISEVRRDHPDVLFLAEAFTRPKVMKRLAKVGFTHSYTYFAWRNDAHGLRAYLEELTRSEMKEYFRPHLWPNTPDILTEHLQTGGRGAFMARLVLAATLCPNYGIYGPPYERMEREPWRPGSEEYRDSEKFAVRHWPPAADDLSGFVARVNAARRQNPALLREGGLVFHDTDNPHLLAYSKRLAGADGRDGGDGGDGGDNTVLVVVNLDPHHTHEGWTGLDLGALGVGHDEEFQVHDLLTDARFLWRSPHNFVRLDPHHAPAHVLRVQRRQTVNT